MKRRILPLLMALAALLAGCGGSAESYNPEDLAQAILAEVDFAHGLTRAEGGALENLYAMNDAVGEYAIYYDAGAFSAEEVAVLKAADGKDAASLRPVLDARLENLAFIFESYNPSEMQKIGSPVLFTSGDIAVMVLSDDAGAYDKVAALFE